MGLGLRRMVERGAGSFPLLRRSLIAAHLMKARIDPFARKHPFDRRFGVQTQGQVPLFLSKTGQEADRHMIPYAGCVASALRRALDVLPNVSTASFLDLGCGKGRALIVASERPFAKIIGVEINPDLVRVARRNARLVRRRYPDRPPIEVIEGDASAPVLPPGPMVIFLYHPFGEALVDRLCAHIERTCAVGDDLIVIYENPVHGHILDGRGDFERWFSDNIANDPEERGHGFDTEESIVMWRLNRWRRPASPPYTCPHDAHKAIVVTKPGYRAVLR